MGANRENRQQSPLASHPKSERRRGLPRPARGHLRARVFDMRKERARRPNPLLALKVPTKPGHAGSRQHHVRGVASARGGDGPALVRMPLLPQLAQRELVLGVSYWIKPGTSNTVTTYLFEVPTLQTYMFKDGAYAIVSKVMPTAGEWTNVQVHWSDLAPASWGAGAELTTAFDQSSIVAMQWELQAALTSEAFDVSIGGVEFLP
jgi:hypothetical protein